VEAGTNGSLDLGVVLDRMEAAVSSGRTDLRELGFWGIVARVKLGRVLVDEHAGQIGRIDTAAFRARVRLRVPVWAGNALLLLGVVLGGAAVAVAFVSDTAWVAGLALVAAGGIWAVSFHGLAHWLVGRAIGIGFTDQFLAGRPLPRPGLKTDYATYLEADPDSRAWFHASGAIATKLAPFLALAFWPASGAPGWSALALLALGALMIVTDVTLSVSSSDWMRFAREKRVARSMEPPPGVEPPLGVEPVPVDS
jgi:hypothetical protein